MFLRYEGKKWLMYDATFNLVETMKIVEILLFIWYDKCIFFLSYIKKIQINKQLFVWIWNIIYIIRFIFCRILIYLTTNFVKDFKFLSSSFYYSNEFNVVFMPTLNQLFVLIATPISCAYGCKHFFWCNNLTLQKVHLSFWLKVIELLRK